MDDAFIATMDALTDQRRNLFIKDLNPEYVLVGQETWINFQKDVRSQSYTFSNGPFCNITIMNMQVLFKENDPHAPFLILTSGARSS